MEFLLYDNSGSFSRIHLMVFILEQIRNVGICLCYTFVPELQIRRGNRDNSKTIFHISQQKHML